MTVADLIAKLQTLPPQLTVVVQMDRNELSNGSPVAGVTVREAQTRDCCRYVGCDGGWLLPLDDYSLPMLVVNLTGQVQ
jgi:hypothetical protein